MPENIPPKPETKCQVPEDAVTKIDSSVLKCLPDISSAEDASIAPHGESFWTRTAKIITKSDGLEKAYFLKTSYGSLGHQMAHSEYTSMSTIANITPDFVPQPIASGTYTSDPSISFILLSFHRMTSTLHAISIPYFTANLARMHRLGTSPNHKFGFHIPTFHGSTPIEHPWCDTWEEYFTITTKKLLEMEQGSRGRDAEIEGLKGRFFGEVVPRLLRPLEGSIRPALIHGDLWHGNVGVEEGSGRPLIFDAGCFYAHNEYELGVWRQSWNRLGEPEHFAEYLRHFPKSAPEEGFDARNELYAVRVDILDSYLYKDESRYRDNLRRGMKSLVQRFASDNTQ